MLTPTPVAELPRIKHQPPIAVPSEKLAQRIATSEPEAFFPASVPMNFGRNAEIYAEDETAGYVYKLVSGVVRISKLLPDGRRQISAFHLPGDMFGFEVGDLHHASAEAVGSVKVIAFKWHSLSSATASNALVHELLNRTMIGLRQTQDHLLLLGRKNALERLFSFESAPCRGPAPPRSGTNIPEASTCPLRLGLKISTPAVTLSPTSAIEAGLIAAAMGSCP